MRARSRLASAVAPALVAASLAVFFAFVARASEPAPGLNVQREWRIVGVAAATSVSPALARGEVERALAHAASTIRGELQIRWTVSQRVRRGRYEDDERASLELNGAGFRTLVERLAEKDDEVARADVVFVYVAAPMQDYAGMSVLRAHPRGKPPVWYAVVNTRQGPRMARRALAQVTSDLARVGVNVAGEERDALGQALRLAASPLDHGEGRRLALWATTVHEFGHLLAPGTKDVRAVGELSGWIGNGPEEPERHSKACVMWTPDPASLLAKLRAFPHVVQFCDGCRERLGLEPRGRRTPLLEAAPRPDLE